MIIFYSFIHSLIITIIIIVAGVAIIIFLLLLFYDLINIICSNLLSL